MGCENKYVKQEILIIKRRCIFTDWKQEAIEKLKEYSLKKNSIATLTDEIRELQSRRRSIQSSGSDGMPVSGGTNRREDMLTGTIVRQKELEENLRVVSRWVKRVEAGLAALDEKERCILERFYIHPEKNAADRLAMDFGIDVKTVYYRKNIAVIRFTKALYGITEI